MPHSTLHAARSDRCDTSRSNMSQQPPWAIFKTYLDAAAARAADELVPRWTDGLGRGRTRLERLGSLCRAIRNRAQPKTVNRNCTFRPEYTTDTPPEDPHRKVPGAGIGFPGGTCPGSSS